MLTTGFKDTTDQSNFSLVPGFWYDRDVLYKKYIQDKYAGNLSLIESSRIGSQVDPSTVQAYNEFLMKLPDDYWIAGHRTAPTQITSKLSRAYQAWLRNRYKSISELNQAYLEENLAFEAVVPPNEMLERKSWQPTAGRKYEEWKLFKKQLPAEFRIPVREERIFQEFLRSKFENQIDKVPVELKEHATKFEQIPLTKGHPLYQEFRTKALPTRCLQETVESLWSKHHTGPLPIEAAEKKFVAEHASELRKEFSLRNYLYVLDYILLHGRSLWNTATFCILAVLLQLGINALAAYALSRYQIRTTAKILIFLLATMAFPAEVTLIPAFLLLKDLGLLNTFAALVLPTAVSGYTIFLLKGFFDSLPQELFESGQIDGAKETTMMAKIAFPLSKPVLGYVALLAFMGAYSAFMYAFLVAQDQRMWTLMVWIYQLQISAPKATIMAALTVAAIPTILVFLLAQRTITRGIILPGER
jgi:multiple sugar transport system permease protein